MTQFSRSGCSKQLVSLGLQTVYRPLLQSGKVMVRKDLFIRDQTRQIPYTDGLPFRKDISPKGKAGTKSRPQTCAEHVPSVNSFSPQGFSPFASA